MFSWRIRMNRQPILAAIVFVFGFAACSMDLPRPSEVQDIGEKHAELTVEALTQYSKKISEFDALSKAVLDRTGYKIKEYDFDSQRDLIQKFMNTVGIKKFAGYEPRITIKNATPDDLRFR